MLKRWGKYLYKAGLALVLAPWLLAEVVRGLARETYYGMTSLMGKPMKEGPKTLKHWVIHGLRMVQILCVFIIAPGAFVAIMLAFVGFQTEQRMLALYGVGVGLTWLGSLLLFFLIEKRLKAQPPRNTH